MEVIASLISFLGFVPVSLQSAYRTLSLLLVQHLASLVGTLVILKESYLLGILTLSSSLTMYAKAVYRPVTLGLLFIKSGRGVNTP